MPETYGLPEDEPERIERFEAVIANAIAGQGIVRRVVLYALTAGSLMGMAFLADSAFGLVGILGIVAVIMLMATDSGLS